jgi:hypothetical protein
MSELERAARLALDALKNMLSHADALVNSKVLGPHFYHHDRAKSRRAIDALRAALTQQAEPVVEPVRVRWDRPCYKCKSHHCDRSCKQAEPVQAEPVADADGNASY